MSDILHIRIIGDRNQGEAYIGFARKKLAEIIGLGIPKKKIPLETGASVFLQQTGDRQEIIITIPPVTVSEKKPKKYVSEIVEGLLFFYGMPYEQLQISGADGPFVPGAVICSDGSGEVEQIAGGGLLGMFQKCWEPGETVLCPSTKATATLVECWAMVYQYTYTSYTLFSDFIFREGWLVSSPADIFPRMCRDNLNKEFRTHSKTYGLPTIGWMTLTAVEAQPYAAFGLKTKEWFLCAKYNGKQVLFDDAFSTDTLSRGFFGNQPVLFDLWEMGGIFHASRASGAGVDLWVHDPEENRFVRQERKELRDYSLIGNRKVTSPLGLCRETIYRVVFGVDSFTLLYEDYTDGSEYYEPIYISGDYRSALWNHFNDTIYIAYERTPEEKDPPPPQQYTELLYISMHVVGRWFTCYYAGSLMGSSCSCWVCNLPGYECPDIPAMNPVESGITVGSETYTWSVVVAADVDIGTSVDVFWHTYHLVGVMKAPTLYQAKDLVIQSFKNGKRSFGGSEFIGGSYFYGDTRFFTLRDGLYFYIAIPYPPGGPQCSGEVRTYDIDKWVFTADKKGYFLELDVGVATYDMKADCNPAFTSYTTHVGDNAYAPGNSYAPWDHNWTAILKEDSCDIEGDPLTPTLVYVDGETSENLFYGQEHGGVSDLPGNGNRAFFQYDKSEYWREVT